ncbi:MAG: GbsR/MarR family transcriptional regulator [Saprospiraceae bacterium]
MQFEEAKEQFIQAWGTLGSNWGVNRTMAQIHALLLMSPEALTTEDIRAELDISSGNANMNLRALMDWGLVHKKLKPGERKEYFVAEKDMWEVVKNIIIQRKKRELEPMLKALDELQDVEVTDEKSEEFARIITEVKMFAGKANATLDSLTKSDSNWFVGTFMKMIK